MRTAIVKGMEGVVRKMREWKLEDEIQRRERILIEAEDEVIACHRRLVESRDKLQVHRTTTG